jgi:hypothetical protein
MLPPTTLLRLLLSMAAGAPLGAVVLPAI